MTIRVIGLVAGNHHIEDISVTVPHDTVREIPDELALRSKDLWRAINQRLLFRLNGPFDKITTVPAAPPVPPPIPTSPPEAPREDRVTRIEEENRALKGQLAQQAVKLDGILAALERMAQQPAQVIHVPAGGRHEPQQDRPADMPLFIPSTIKPLVGESNIEIPETTGDSLSDAAAKLKELRKKKAGQ